MRCGLTCAEKGARRAIAGLLVFPTNPSTKSKFIRDCECDAYATQHRKVCATYVYVHKCVQHNSLTVKLGGTRAQHRGQLRNGLLGVLLQLLTRQAGQLQFHAVVAARSLGRNLAEAQHTCDMGKIDMKLKLVSKLVRCGGLRCLCLCTVKLP